MPRCIVLILMLTGLAMTASAQDVPQAQTENKELKKNVLYQWTDDKGVVHIVDSLDKVPKTYREKAIKVKQRNREDDEQGPQVREENYPSGADTEAADAAEKEAWQQRIRAARQRLADAEKSYQELVQRRDEVIRNSGGPAYGRRPEFIEADRIEQEMKVAQREIDDARNDLDVVLPEIARKAGIPPGWLRE